MTEISTHYTGKKACEYAQGRFGETMDYGRTNQSRYFSPYTSERTKILDFGCGDGTILRTLKAAVKIGIEVNPACQEVIEVKNADSVPPIILYREIEDVSSETLDLVISNHCLEHVPHPLLVLQQMKRVLAPSGLVVIVVPFDDWRSAKNRNWRPGDKDHHLYTWSPMSIGNLISEAGLAVRETRLCTRAWSPKIFWIGKYLGRFLFDLTCFCLAIVKRRREILCVAQKA